MKERGKQWIGIYRPYCPGENEFHNYAAVKVVAHPELGFLFPAFDDRAANIYNALAYSRQPDELHQEFLDAIFHIEPPMSAGEQREAFQSALTEALDGTCCPEVVQAVHSELTERMEQHKSKAVTRSPSLSPPTRWGRS